MNKVLAVVVGMAMSGLAYDVPGAVISAVGNGADRVFNADGTAIWDGQAEMRVGSTGNASTLHSAAVFVFQLPALPDGEQVVSADFTSVVINASDWRALSQKGLDLYGLRVSNAATVLASDWYTGPYGGDATEATGIQEHFVYQPNDYNGAMDPIYAGARSTSGAGQTNLGVWLDSIYSGDANAAGKYVFLRLNGQGDIGTGSSRYWTFGSMNNSTVANRPTLTLTTDVIPEPASLAFLGVAFAALQLRRRR